LSRADKARLAAIRCLEQVLPADGGGASLRDVVARERQALSPQERGLMMDLCYGVCRHYRLLDAWLATQLKKPIRASAWPVQLSLLCGVHELWFSRRPAHAVVNSWPEVCRAHKATWAVGLVNAVLRKAAAINEIEAAAGLDPARRWSLPDWLWQRLQQAWPDQAPALAEALCDSAPLTVRLAPAHAAQLDVALRDAGLTVRACDAAEFGRTLFPAHTADQLPGFVEGQLSVQDEAAQLPAVLLDVPEGGRVLDACAAPGGKTGQIAERYPAAELVALDVDGARLKQVRHNCTRLGISPTLLQGDAATPTAWWDGTPFDAVLLDVPCSATGIIRRQPDLKWHRRASDIEALCGLQSRMLDAIWPLIKPGGVLVYATCSILPEENAEPISAFLARHADAREDTPTSARSVETRVGCQLLPQPGGHDGFFFARLRKS